MIYKNIVVLFIVFMSVFEFEVHAKGDATGNVLFAEHFAQVRCLIGDGGIGGPAKQSSMNSCNTGLPNMTSDTAGNFYFVSGAHNKIFWMNTSGIVTAIAGSDISGLRDGVADEAYFAFGGGMYMSTQIHCDNNGGVYVLDGNNNRIRKTYRLPDSTWMVSTVVGGGTKNPTQGVWISADQITVAGAGFFAMSPDKSEIYFVGWADGLVKVKLNGNSASENMATMMVTTGDAPGRMWKSAGYVTADSQLYWMPGDPGKIQRCDLSTGIIDRFSGFDTHYANFDGTSRLDAGFHTVLLAVSPTGKTMFTASGDEAAIRRIYQDTVKHLLQNGSFRKQNNEAGTWSGSAEYVDENGFFHSMGGVHGNGGQDINVRLTFEGSDTTQNHVKKAIKIVLLDSLTNRKVALEASVAVKQSGVVVCRELDKTGIVYLYVVPGTGYMVDVSAAGYYPISDIPVTLGSGRTTELVVRCRRAPASALAIHPDTLELSNLSQYSLQAFAVYPGGIELAWDPLIAIMWISRSPGVVSVGNTGVLSSDTVDGTCYVVATVPSLGFADSVRVTVRKQYLNVKFHWKLDETSGATASDASGNTNTATLQGAPVWGAGKIDNGLTFNGSTDYLSTALNVTAPDVFTVSLWLKTTTTAGGWLIGFGKNQTIGSPDYDRVVKLNKTGTITFWCYPGSMKAITSITAVNDGLWHHVTATLSGAGMMLYVDGVMSASNAAVTSAQAYTGYWKSGYAESGENVATYFAGQLDDIRVYDIALGASEIALLGGFGAAIEGEPAAAPGELSLLTQPNPFNPSVMLRVNGWRNGASELKIMDVSGKVVADLTSALNNGSQGARTRQVSWNAMGQASGVYVVALKNGKRELARKVMLIH